MSFTGFKPGDIRAALDDAQARSRAKMAEAMQKLAEATDKYAAVPAAIERTAARVMVDADEAMAEIAAWNAPVRLDNNTPPPAAKTPLPPPAGLNPVDTVAVVPPEPTGAIIDLAPQADAPVCPLNIIEAANTP